MAQNDGDALFIKVPGYRHILRDLVGVQQILANMHETIEVLNEVQRVKEKSIEVFIENVDRLNEQMTDIDAQFPEVHDMDIHVSSDVETGQEDEIIDEAIRDLKGELDGLRSELEHIEG